jgi:hypothetical protein
MKGPHDGRQKHEAQEGIGGNKAQGACLTLAYGARTSLQLGHAIR